jgi:hypothetical protein
MKYIIDKRFEYKEIEINSLSRIEYELNDLGKLGWNLVNFVYDNSIQKYVMILKRPYYDNQ